jgi:hypothetical protein
MLSATHPPLPTASGPRDSTTSARSRGHVVQTAVYGNGHTKRPWCRIVDGMTSPRIPSPKDIRGAAQAAAETAQSVASGAMRIPPASMALASQLPDLLENLATTTERLNLAIDRAERYLALADPMIRTMDAILPQLEALVATGNDVFTAVSAIRGVSTLGRFATRGSDEPPKPKPPRGMSARRDS